ncbi:hypothetical protein ACROYT_G006108 [Oculina patagonica]
MDVKSLYTVIPNKDGLLALEHFLDKRSVLQPPTHTLLRLAELVLTLNTFTFNGNYDEQVGGVAMGSRFGPNYACLFMGHIEEQIFEQYPGRTPDLFKSQLLRLKRICSEADDFNERSKEMVSYFLDRKYPPHVVNHALNQIASISREDLLQETPTQKAPQQPTIPLVLTYHPSNARVKKIMTKNLDLLKDDPQTGEIFQPVRILCAYRRDSNLRDALVQSTLGNETNGARADFGTSLCARPRCKTCDYTNATPVINAPGGSIHVHQRYTCTTTHAVYIIQCRACAKCYIGETGRRLADRFREHLRSITTQSDTPVAEHFNLPGHSTNDMLVSVLCAGLTDTMEKKRLEAKLIFRYKTLRPRGLNLKHSFGQKEKDAQSQIYSVWQEKEKLQREVANLELQLKMKTKIAELDRQIQLQMSGLKPIGSHMLKLILEYSKLAAALDTTRHHMSVNGVFIPDNHDELFAVLDESERLLGEIDGLTKQKQQKIDSFAKEMEGLSKTVESEIQEQNRCGELLAAASTLSTQERSLQAQTIMTGL